MLQPHLERSRQLLEQDGQLSLQGHTPRCSTILGAHLSPGCTVAFEVLRQAALLKLRPAANDGTAPADSGAAAPSRCRQQLRQLVTIDSGILEHLYYSRPRIKRSSARQQADKINAQLQRQVIDAVMAAAAQQLGKAVEELSAYDVVAALPAGLECDARLELYKVGRHDPRTFLRGEQGVRITQDVEAWTLLGPYASVQVLGCEGEEHLDYAPPCLVHKMAEVLQGLHEPDAMVEVPGALRPYLAWLHVSDPALAAQAVRTMLGACAQLHERPGEDTHLTGAGGSGSSVRGPRLVGRAPAGRLASALVQLAVQHLREAVREAGFDVSEEEAKDDAVVQCMVDLAEDLWATTRERFGVDCELPLKLRLSTFAESLEALLSKADAKSLGSSLASVSIDVARRVGEELSREEFVTCTALQWARNLTALVNDPVLRPPDANSPDSSKEYSKHAASANAIMIAVHVLGWPVPFMVSCKDLRRHDSVSYAYGLEAYWQRRRPHREDAKAGLQLELHRVRQQCRQRTSASASASRRRQQLQPPQPGPKAAPLPPTLQQQPAPLNTVVVLRSSHEPHPWRAGRVWLPVQPSPQVLPTAGAQQVAPRTAVAAGAPAAGEAVVGRGVKAGLGVKPAATPSQFLVVKRRSATGSGTGVSGDEDVNGRPPVPQKQARLW